MSYNNIKVIHVVAMDLNKCIGKDNQLPWHLRDDLKHFKAITQKGIIIMGRKTYESIGHPLPDRFNIVISRDADFEPDNMAVAGSLDSALKYATDMATVLKHPSVFIIGGAEIFNQTLDIADELKITRVWLSVGGDTFYPTIPPEFSILDFKSTVDSKSGTTLDFYTYFKPRKITNESTTEV